MLSFQHPQYPNTAEHSRAAAYYWSGFRTGDFFFSCEGKHYIALDTDSYTLKVITQDGLNVC